MVQHLPPVHHTLPTPHPDEPKTKGIDEDEGKQESEGAEARGRHRPAIKRMGDAEPGRRLRCWRVLGRRHRRRRLPVVRPRAGNPAAAPARRVAAIYLAALAGPAAPPGAASSTCPPWLGLQPCFATPFVASAKPC